MCLIHGSMNDKRFAHREEGPRLCSMVKSFSMYPKISLSDARQKTYKPVSFVKRGLSAKPWPQKKSHELHPKPPFNLHVILATC